MFECRSQSVLKGISELLGTPYLLNSKNLELDERTNILLTDDFALMRHVLLVLSNSNDLQMKRDSDRQDDAQDSGSTLLTTLSSLPDM